MQNPFPSRISLAILVAALAGFTATSLHADTVVLKNGDRLTGTAVKLDGGKLTFKTPYADAIAISWDQVTTLTTDKPLVLPTAKGTLDVTGVERTTTGLVVTTPSGPSTFAAADVAVLRSPADQKAYENSLHPGLGHGWTGAANVSLALARGNADTTSFGVGVTAVRPTLHDKTSLYYSSLYASDGNSTPSLAANQNGGGIRYDHNLNPRLFAFGTGDFLADELQDLDLRSIVGGGFGLHVSKTPKQTLDVLGGLVWTHEKYSATTSAPQTINSFAALDLGEQYTRKLGANSLFAEQFTIYPDLNSLSQYQFTLNSTFSTKLVKMFTWNTTVSDNYTSFPPSGTQSNDFILTTGLGVALTRK